MLVHPSRDQRSIRIHDIVTEAISKGLKPPLTIRIQDLLRTRVVDLNELFAQAIKDEDYQASIAASFRLRSTSCVK